MARVRLTPRYTIPYWLRMGTPRSCHDHLALARYGIDLQSGVAVMHTRDRCDGEECWYLCDLTEDEQIALEGYDAGGATDPPVVSGSWREVNAQYDPREGD